jgi:hypothetical protein
MDHFPKHFEETLAEPGTTASFGRGRLYLYHEIGTIVVEHEA